MGKKIRNYFKDKNMITASRPSQLLDMDLLSPIKTKVLKENNMFLL